MERIVTIGVMEQSFKGLLISALVMALSVLLFAGVPVAIVAGGGSEAPFLFNGLLRLGTVAVMVATMRMLAGRVFWSCRLWRSLLADMRSWVFPLGVANYFEYMFFGWAVTYVDPVLVTVMFGSWPMVVMFILSSLDERSLGRLDCWWVLALVGCTVGMGMAVWSYGAASGVHISGWLDTVLGLSVSLAGMICAGFSGFAVWWARDAGMRVPVELAGRLRREMVAMMAFVVLTGLVSGVGSLALGLSRREQVDGSMLVWGLLIAGMVLNGVGNVMWRLSNLVTRHFVVNCLCYLVPVLTVLMLWWTGLGVVRMPWLFGSGLTLVVAGNFLAALGAVRYPWRVPVG